MMMNNQKKVAFSPNVNVYLNSQTLSSDKQR